MEYLVTNFKISFKCPLLFLDNVSTITHQQNLDTKVFNNFIVFKKKFNFIIFKAKRTLNHINVTKLSTREDILESVQVFEQLFSCQISNLTIDNIIAVSKFPEFLNLSKISQHTFEGKIKYNSEKFPGLFIKFKEGTVILFHSGKVVVVGCKTESNIECLLKRICAYI